MQTRGIQPNLPSSDQQTMNTFALMASRGNPMAAVLFIFFSALIGIVSFAVKPILRKNLGERTFGILTIFLTYALIRYFYLFDAMGSIPKDLSWMPGYFFRVDTGLAYYPGFFRYPSPVGLYGYVLLCFAIAELISVWKNKEKKIKIHSQYRGDSRFFEFLIDKNIVGVVITRTIIRVVIEPVIVLAIGLLLYICGDHYFAYLLFLSAGTLIVEEYIFYIRRRQMLLDMLDNEIDGERLLAQKETYKASDSKHPANAHAPQSIFLGGKAVMD